MGELGLNKIFGAILAVALAIMGLKEVSSMVFGGGHHGSHSYESLNEWASENFHGYRIDIAEVGGAGGDVVEEIYDLGLLLANADAAKGERSFKGKCASCHTIEQGGANGTGPNLYATVGAPKQHVDGFAYSGVLASIGGDWTYENLDAWLQSPSKYARGTSMAFAGLNRDGERADMLAYLASYTPNAPAFPEPLPETVDEASLEGVAEDVAGDAATVDTAVIDASEGAVVPAAVSEGTQETVGDVAETVEESVEAVVDAAETAAEDAGATVTDVVEAVEEAAEEVVEDVTAEE